MANIALASPWVERDKIVALALQIQETTNHIVVSRWLNTVPPPLDIQYKRLAWDNVEDIEHCDLLICFPKADFPHINADFGIAYALRKQIWVVGGKLDIIYEHDDSRVRFVPDIDTALSELQSWDVPNRLTLLKGFLRDWYDCESMDELYRRRPEDRRKVQNLAAMIRRDYGIQLPMLPSSRPQQFQKLSEGERNHLQIFAKSLEDTYHENDIPETTGEVDCKHIGDSDGSRQTGSISDAAAIGDGTERG